MKTNLIVLKNGSLLLLVMAAVMGLTTTACEKDPGPEITQPEALYFGNVMNQQFWVNPEGGTVNLFDGIVEIFFPEGAVSSLTQFTFESFPVDHLDLDGFNLYNRGFALEGSSSNQVFPTGITIKLKYDMNSGSWLKDLPTDEENLKIYCYCVSPIQLSYEKLVPFENCCVDRTCKIIKGCIGKCGFYVVGEV